MASFQWSPRSGVNQDERRLLISDATRWLGCDRIAGVGEHLLDGQAVRILHMSRHDLWLRNGFITREQLVAGGPWRIRIDDAVRAKVVGEAPDGWVSLDEASRTPGIARQTVLDRIRRGELRAVHANRGRRRRLAIDVGATGATLAGTTG